MSVVMPLRVQFTQAAWTSVADAAGSWQFEGGQVAETAMAELGGRPIATPAARQIGNYASTKRIIAKGTDQNSQNTSMATTTIFFIQQIPPQNITLEGVHDLTTGNEIGSVSAASGEFLGYIGKPYSRNGANNLVTIG